LKILDKNSTRTVFSSPDIFNNLHAKAINCCGTVRPSGRGMPSDFGRKLRLKQGDIEARVKGDFDSCSMER
jgi:hypothetical protein